MNWQPHLCEEEITTRRDGSVTRYVRHWIFGVLVWDTFPKKSEFPVSPRLNPEGDGYTCDLCERSWKVGQVSGCESCRNK
jgi:hypothetical protein